MGINPVKYGIYKNKVLGCVLGTAIGDALGMPAEGMTKNEIISNYGRIEEYLPPKNHFKNILNAGDYTDDTEQTICLIRSITKEGFDKNLFVKELIKWYKNNPIGIGPTSKKAIEKLINGDYSGIDSKTCGAAMRISPLGIFYYDNPKMLKEAIIEASKITHNNSEAIAGALTVGFLVSWCLNNSSYNNNININNSSESSKTFLYNHPKNFISELVKFIRDISEVFAEKILLIKKIRTLDEGYELFGTGMDAIECVPSAILTFYLTDDFKTGMINAINAGGDTDSLGSIYGAIAGTYYGINHIPEKWVMNINNRHYLTELGNYLFNLKFQTFK
ncbi:ADP-ribosylglycohydrolase family protein [Methanothermococcus okinawensis]|uniref:ADP-ribosylation/Crystallin J1 n=1 Tax=Methanothermococcus okinawensis (strain DSM 14208 / JCM 11175 / IH1) TaxID=647113 RepID=F8ALN5_METOI|nr:ADP-ribosylglycohydrolase family protein [Methanothermococcus okinawensis]AEH06583.1 ADP-ribosylation/Crystallin J1 [Methanothermococcus okinawensis IH1]